MNISKCIWSVNTFYENHLHSNDTTSSSMSHLSPFSPLCLWFFSFFFLFLFFFFFIFKVFSADTHVLFWGHWYPCFGFLVTYPLGSKPEWVLPYSLFAEANVMYIPWDPPLVLHLPTSWWPVCSQSCPHILLQRWDCRDSNSCSQNICESDALPTELNRDRHWFFFFSL